MGDEMKGSFTSEDSHVMAYEPRNVQIHNKDNKVVWEGTYEEFGKYLDLIRSGAADTDDMLETAWGIIANASDWNVDQDARMSVEWRDAAIRWRDRYHEHLDVALSGDTP